MRFGDKAINETEAKEIMNELTDNAPVANEGLVNLLQLIKNSDMKQLFGGGQQDE